MDPFIPFAIGAALGLLSGISLAFGIIAHKLKKQHQGHMEEFVNKHSAELIEQIKEEFNRLAEQDRAEYRAKYSASIQRIYRSSIETIAYMTNALEGQVHRMALRANEKEKQELFAIPVQLWTKTIQSYLQEDEINTGKALRELGYSTEPPFKKL